MIMMGLMAWIWEESHSNPKKFRFIFSACSTQADPVWSIVWTSPQIDRSQRVYPLTPSLGTKCLFDELNHLLECEWILTPHPKEHGCESHQNTWIPNRRTELWIAEKPSVKVLKWSHPSWSTEPSEDFLHWRALLLPNDPQRAMTGLNPTRTDCNQCKPDHQIVSGLQKWQMHIHESQWEVTQTINNWKPKNGSVLSKEPVRNQSANQWKEIHCTCEVVVPHHRRFLVHKVRGTIRRQQVLVIKRLKSLHARKRNVPPPHW